MNSRLDSITFEDEDTLELIQQPDFNKVCGYVDVSIKMLKICDVAIVKPSFYIISLLHIIM